MTAQTFLAVDLGASSGRVMTAAFDGGRISLKEAHRFVNGPVHAAGHMYWDVLALWSEIQSGMRAAAGQAGQHEITSVGVDAWGVDFCLLGADGRLLANPFHYRDPHTSGMMEAVLEAISRRSIFQQTGLQFMPINTLYQIVGMHRAGNTALSAASRFLMIPDLFHWLMTGVATNEFTNATTTQFFNPQQRTWATELLAELGINSSMLGDVIEPSTDIGPMTRQVQEQTGLGSSVRVIAPGTHDTASAVVAVPAETDDSEQPNWCYLSSGTWSLMGVESRTPVISDDCLRLNFTNEGGVCGTWRVLKNIAGLWLLQECRRVWVRDGHHYEWETLCEMAASAPPLQSLVNPDSPRFASPRNMPAEITAACVESGQPEPANHAAVVRCALESLALKYRQVLGWLEQLIGREIATIHIVGGGAHNAPLNQATADACGRRVLAGPTEATALGNALVQAIATGAVADLSQARAIVRDSYDIREFTPRTDAKAAWDQAFERFVQLSPEPIGV